MIAVVLGVGVVTLTFDLVTPQLGTTLQPMLKGLFGAAFQHIEQAGRPGFVTHPVCQPKHEPTDFEITYKSGCLGERNAKANDYC